MKTLMLKMLFTPLHWRGSDDDPSPKRFRKALRSATLTGSRRRLEARDTGALEISESTDPEKSGGSKGSEPRKTDRQFRREMDAILYI